ncbi:amino acid permease [Actinomadura viridis]|uniref:Amino acid transporter n=1 Tax=Actinomadura viridis TaxID=58110 RepID=A0A931GLR3_9ACTN|nr:amino acid permease [Actinomadura viridis]MBG6087726.1 amino acid transporter [Actinomadura viridis]
MSTDRDPAAAPSETGPETGAGAGAGVDAGVDADAARLAALGYEPHFRRDMSLWANFSLGFTYLSPVVGVYALFGFSLATAGPPMIWAFVIAGVGQLLVALVFGEIVSQYPVSGGIYPWARRLWGRRWAWMSGWVYLVALLATIASVSYGAGPYAASMLGFRPTATATIGCALAILAVATLINLAGTRYLALAAIIGFAAELLGALAVGIWLLATERHHGLGVLFDGQGAGEGGSYAAAFLAASLIGIFQYYGFEACGDVAEEVRDPARRIPRAMRMTIYVGGAAATFVTLALVLSVADFGAVISEADADPVTTALTAAFGPVAVKVILGVVLVSFVSCAMSLQAAASRLTYSYARDRMIAGSGLLARFSAARHVPPYALLLAAVLPALLVIGSKVSADALTKIISFASLGIYLGFQMVVLAALRARLKGWRPAGPFTLGRWGPAVNVAALVYGIAAMVNMSWPRTPEAPWYDDYIVPLSGAVVIALGLAYMAATRHHGRGDAPAGDAVPVPARPGRRRRLRTTGDPW